jgi:ATP-binding cassette, subfamily B, multidrug efflux pump
MTPKKNDKWGDLIFFKRIWPFVKDDLWVFLGAMLLSPVIVCLSLAQPYLIKTAIDEHIVPGKYEGLTSIAGSYLLVVFFVYLLSAVYTVGIAWGGMRMLVRLREYLYDRVLSLPQRFLDRKPAGVLLTRLTSDVDAIGESISAGVVTIGLDVLMIIGCICAMFFLDPTLTILLACCSPVLLIVIELIRRQLKKLFLLIRETIASVNAHLAEQIDGVEILQLFNAEERSEQKFDERNWKFRNACTTSNIYDSLMFAIVDGMGAVFIALMLWYGAGYAVSLGLPVDEFEAKSAGLMVAFIDYLNRLLIPIRDLSSKISVIQRALAAMTKIFGLVDAEEPMSLAGEDITSLTGSIQLRDVWFRYSENAPDVIKGINLDIAAKEVVAIVGSSGSGKTTMSRILDKSYLGYRGSIKVDGKELRGISLSSLRKNIASVRQDIQIFSRSLLFNVSLENERIGVTDCKTAVEMACADGFVEKLGWDYTLRERGGDLSVGEGQLLTFARTLAYDSSVVILDEATASVDSLTEAKIQLAIENIFSEKTVIVIAHRLSTIQRADRIVVLEAGKIIEEGTHKKLLLLGGRYSQLVEAGKAVVGN